LEFLTLLGEIGGIGAAIFRLRLGGTTGLLLAAFGTTGNTSPGVLARM
jgi:hypothetical protein